MPPLHHSFVSRLSNTVLCVLYQIAQDLDEAEKKLMLESGMESADYLRFLAEESGNVAGKVAETSMWRNPGSRSGWLCIQVCSNLGSAFPPLTFFAAVIP